MGCGDGPAAGIAPALEQADAESGVDGQVGGHQAGQPTADDLEVDEVLCVVVHALSTGRQGET
jgi:hypothetical protein